MPKDWPTLGEDRGFKRGENAVTGEPIGNFYVENISTVEGGDSAKASLLGMVPWLNARYADKDPSAPPPPIRTDPDRSNGFVMFPDTFANLLRDAGGPN